MKIIENKNNVCVVESLDGHQILFSYKVPVACVLATGEAYKTSTKWSQTTSRHIKAFLNGRACIEKPQEFFSNI